VKQHFVIIGPEGFVEAAGFGNPPEGAIIVDSSLCVFDLSLLYVDGANGLVPRPTLATPTLDGDDLSIPSGPEGTRLRVVDRLADEVMWEVVTGADLTTHVLTLPDAGTYIVDIDPPMPWVPLQVEFKK
tara:strand:+ start:664 stop:1050 length:387 start_codon:yes stop_codon:yes gene_type:complete